jgi:hypothetical protein
MYNQLIKNDGTTAVNTALTVRGIWNEVTWSDSNCPTVLTGVLNNVTYTGGPGSIIIRGLQETLLLSPQTNSTLTVTQLQGVISNVNLGSAGVANQTYNLGSGVSGITSIITAFNDDVGNTGRLINITEYKSFRSFNSFGGVAGGTPATNCITTIGTYTMFSGELFFQQNGTLSTSTITNLYGLRLPSATYTGTITNNWGISQETTTAKNYFAGKVGIGTTTINNALDVVGDATISNSLRVPQITNTASIELAPNTTTGDLIFTGTNLQSATSGANTGQHLRIKLNGVYYKIRLEADV